MVRENTVCCEEESIIGSAVPALIPKHTLMALFFRRATNDPSCATGERDSSDCSGRDTDFTRGFVRLIRYLCLDEGKQALVLLRGSKELEGDATGAHRTNHPGHFKRKFTFVKRQLQVEDVVRMNLGLALDDTAAHREIKYRSFTANLTPGEREIEPHGNPEMFASIDRMVWMAVPQARREKAMVAGRTMERRDKDERGHMFTRRLRTGAKNAVLLTLRTGKLTTHLNSVPLTTTISRYASWQLMGR